MSIKILYAEYFQILLPVIQLFIPIQLIKNLPCVLNNIFDVSLCLEPKHPQDAEIQLAVSTLLSHCSQRQVSCRLTIPCQIVSTYRHVVDTDLGYCMISMTRITF